jgi:two-component system sensor histidine kinase RegB
MPATTDSLSVPRENLRRVLLVRVLTASALIAATAVAPLVIELSLRPAALLPWFGLLLLLSLLTWMRLRSARPVSEAELAIQLGADVALLSGALYASGGPANPFVSVLLLPLTLAVVALRGWLPWLVAGATVAGYSALMVWHRPLDIPAHDHAAAFQLHLIGMWVNFLLSAVLIAAFASAMLNAVRRRDLQLAAARERGLRDERVLALATFAAGAAHELGTPLSTIAVVAKELQDESGASRQQDLRLLAAQVEHCKQILSRLTAGAAAAALDRPTSRPVTAVVDDALSRRSLIRPEREVVAQWCGLQPVPLVTADETLTQTLVNLLNNAADACAGQVEIEGDWDESEIAIEIRDRGPGITPELAARAALAFFSTKRGGQGLGLFLANATVERFGGRVRMFNRDGGGACTRVTLPRSAAGAAG